MAYKIAYHKKAEKFFLRATQKERERIIKHLETIAQNPYTQHTNLSPLTSTLNSFRIRIGNIRVIYQLNSKSKIIYVYKIRYRGSAYLRK